MAESLDTIITSAFDGENGIYLVHPYIGRAGDHSLDCVIAKSNDYGNLVQATTEVYGANRIYLMCDINADNMSGAFGGANIGFRYE